MELFFQAAFIDLEPALIFKNHAVFFSDNHVILLRTPG